MSRSDLQSLTASLQQGQISRRQFIVRGLALGLSLTTLAAIIEACATAASPTAAPATSSAVAPPTAAPSPSASQAVGTSALSIIGWGGTYGDALKKWAEDPFAAAHSASFTFQEQAKAADSLAKIQAEQANPTVDLWLTTGALPLLLAKSGGLRELTPDVVPNIADIFPVAIQKYQGKTYGAGIHLGAESIIVDNQRIKKFIPDYTPDMLKSWKFLYRPELKNQIAVAGFSSGYGGFMIGTSKPFGGSENDEEKFFAAMKQLAPNVHTVPAGSSYVPLFLSKEIVASMGTPTDAQDLAKNGASVDIAYPLDPLEIFLDYIVAIKNGPQGGTLALQFINGLLDPVTLTNYSKDLGVDSTNSKSVQPTLAAVPPLAPADVLGNGWLIDYDVAIANFDSWNSRWDKEIVPLFGK